MAKFYIDESGDGVLFGPKGRNRLLDKDAQHFFMLGMVKIEDHQAANIALSELRRSLIADPQFNELRCMRPERQQTHKYFHATNDHPDIRSKVFEVLKGLDFRFFGYVVDLRDWLQLVDVLNIIDRNFHYRPDLLYDLCAYTLTALIPILSKGSTTNPHVIIADRNFSRRANNLRDIINHRPPYNHAAESLHIFKSMNLEILNVTVDIQPSFENTGLQIVDYCLWALQRHYQRYESQFLETIWSKANVSVASNFLKPSDHSIYSAATDLPNLDELKERARQFTTAYSQKQK